MTLLIKKVTSEDVCAYVCARVLLCVQFSTERCLLSDKDRSSLFDLVYFDEERKN